MTTLTVMVGLPASGKSTYAKDLAEKTDAIVVSSDAIRAEWYGNEEIQGDPTKIFREVHNRCKEALSRGRSVIMDATNMNAKKRANFLREMPKDINRVCVIMATPFNECYARDCSRARKVGFEVLTKMVRSFEMPYYNEGWDHIEVIYPEDSAELIGNEHWEEECQFDQHNHHHTMTVGDHERVSAEYADQRGFGNDVMIACFWHDCGKIHTQTGPDENGNCHYYNHNNVSAYYFITSRMCKHLIGFRRYDSVMTIASLITWHMIPYQFHKEQNIANAVEQWCAKKGFTNGYAKCLMDLHECDTASH